MATFFDMLRQSGGMPIQRPVLNGRAGMSMGIPRGQMGSGFGGPTAINDPVQAFGVGRYRGNTPDYTAQPGFQALMNMLRQQSMNPFQQRNGGQPRDPISAARQQWLARQRPMVGGARTGGYTPRF
jgi:hypothetical protein